MSILGRMSDIIQGKTQKLLDSLENPSETLDLSYEKMITGLQETKRHLADVVTEQKGLERQINTVKQEAVKGEDNARLALQANREDLAKASLGQKQDALTRLETLTTAHSNISAQAEKLIGYQKKLETRIEQFRTQKEVMKSSYSAAQAQVKVTESLSGVGKNLNGVGDAMRRVEDKVAGMQARADAMDGLLESGILNDPLDKSNAIEREIAGLRSSSAVDSDLERLKAEMAAGK